MPTITMKHPSKRKSLTSRTPPCFKRKETIFDNQNIFTGFAKFFKTTLQKLVSGTLLTYLVRSLKNRSRVLCHNTLKLVGKPVLKIYWEDTVTDIVFGELSQNILRQPCKTFQGDPCQNICWPPCTNIPKKLCYNIFEKLCHNISSRPWENLWGDRCQNILGRHCDDRTHFPRARKWGQIIQSVQRAQLSKSLIFAKAQVFYFGSERCLSIFNEWVEFYSWNVFGCSINGETSIGHPLVF